MKEREEIKKPTRETLVGKKKSNNIYAMARKPQA